MTGATIVRGKRRSVLKGKTKEMYSIVGNSISKGWFNNTMRSKARGNNYAVYNNSGKLAGYAVMGKNLPNLGGSTYLFLIGARPGKGYGTQLLHQIIRNARVRGLKYVMLEPTENRVRAWYRRFGFKNVSNNLMALPL